ncbi:RTA1 like protein-domain-containing protein [Pilaira anomala]|nr:RTA1 like protein-domain-containing protein [Pilaira anomala]
MEKYGNAAAGGPPPGVVGSSSGAGPVNQVLRFYGKIPSVPLASVSLAVFALFALGFTYYIYRKKSSRFLYILPFTALMEVGGYAMRIVCAVDYTDLGRFLGSTVLLLLAPNALCLVNYKAIGEVIRLSNVKSKKFWLRTRFVTWFFFSSDILAFVLQGGGSSMQTSIKAMKTGQAITLIGLAIQLFFLACFACISIYVHRSPKYQFRTQSNPNPMKKLFLCLYITLGFLYIRSIYRVLEYAYGYTGPIARSEWAFYVFDTLMIFFSFVTYAVFYLGDCLPKTNEMEMISNTDENEKTHMHHQSSDSNSSVDHLEKGHVQSHNV